MAGDAVVGGGRLPAGRVVRAEDTGESGVQRDLMWRSDEPVRSSVWHELAHRFQSMRLWPVLLDAAGRVHVLEARNSPDDRGRVDEASTAQVLSELWPWNEQPADKEEADWLAHVTGPYGSSFRGLATTQAPLDPSAIQLTLDYVGQNQSVELGLVPV